MARTALATIDPDAADACAPRHDADPGPSDPRDEVFALLSHEIRTPLNGVIGMAGLLAATPLDATQAAYLDTLRGCADHLLGLVNEMLDLAKLRSGQIVLEPVATDVELLLQGVCELLSPRAHATGLEIGWAVDRETPPLLADDGRLRQILFNLAGNAVKLTAEGGVLVTAACLGDAADGRVRVRFVVQDTGPGLRPQDSARIFEQFVQTAAGARAGGAGLGLAIVKRLADAFEGEVGVESRPGDGARFWFEADFAVAGPPRGDAALAGLRVAVCTASTVLRRAALGQLEACGAVAIEDERASRRCDVRLVDYVSGATPPPNGTPTLVMLTPEDRDRIEGLLGQGYAGWLIKPLRRASLAQRVLAVLGAEEPGRPSPDDGADERARVGAAGAGLRVLLAEDNPVNALLAKAVLRRAGCTVDEACSGGEAVAAATGSAYDLVLMDMRMPDMNGLEATRAIRASGCATPVVALTANAFDDDRRACMDAGMDGFLTKPLDATALEAVLSRLTARAG